MQARPSPSLGARACKEGHTPPKKSFSCADLEDDTCAPMRMFVDLSLITISSGENHDPAKRGEVTNNRGKGLNPICALLRHVALGGGSIHTPLSTEWTMMQQCFFQLKEITPV